jgi:hypothetical protein
LRCSTYSRRRRIRTARPPQTRLLLLFARSVWLFRPLSCLSATARAVTGANSQHSPALSSQAKRNPCAQQQYLPPPPFDRLVFRPSAFLSITTTNISVTTSSSSPSLPPPTYLYPKYLSFAHTHTHTHLNSPSSTITTTTTPHASTSSPVSLSSPAIDSTLVCIKHARL